MGWWAAVAVIVGAFSTVTGGCGAHHGAERSGHCAAPAGAPAGNAPTAFAAAPPVGAVARCPVTGETFTVTAATARAEHQGRHYAFCCPGCKAKFDADPGRFAR